ncbi:hypothetical protein E2C01_072094 [Portunus trituberculatus]|uniref:Uncharacterized protein n=1 Tax=Portunus trituberculatus TaxID=210409 RepID=A0A5B7I6V6_PORTR|nr:hypothetical protein [Portunus trituberculatus]
MEERLQTFGGKNEKNYQVLTFDYFTKLLF